MPWMSGFSLPKFRFELPLKGGELIGLVVFEVFDMFFVEICLSKNNVYVQFPGK